ncbi:hypothetical protein IJ541_06105 [bacterium]|nr:hypothetical protein [bacterium]
MNIKNFGIYAFLCGLFVLFACISASADTKLTENQVNDALIKLNQELVFNNKCDAGVISEYDKLIPQVKDKQMLMNVYSFRAECKKRLGLPWKEDNEKSIQTRFDFIIERSAQRYNNKPYEAMMYDANMAAAHKEPELAIRAYSEAIKLSPSPYPAAYLNRANTKLMLNDIDGAIADYQKALSENAKITSAKSEFKMSKEGVAGAYSGLAGAYSIKGDNKSALTYITKSINLNPNNLPALYNRALIRKDMKQYSLALADVKKIKELNKTTKVETPKNVSEVMATTLGGKKDDAFEKDIDKLYNELLKLNK